MKSSIHSQAFITHLLPINRGQACLARPYPGGLFGKAAARIQTLDPDTAASYLIAVGTQEQPSIDASQFEPAMEGNRRDILNLQPYLIQGRSHSKQEDAQTHMRTCQGLPADWACRTRSPAASTGSHEEG